LRGALGQQINASSYPVTNSAKSLTLVQDNNKDVEIGSYPFFKANKLGVAVVIRSVDQSKIDICNSQILDFANQKNIRVINNE